MRDKQSDQLDISIINMIRSVMFQEKLSLNLHNFCIICHDIICIDSSNEIIKVLKDIHNRNIIYI